MNKFKYRFRHENFIILTFNPEQITDYYVTNESTYYSNLFYESSSTLVRYGNWYFRNMDWFKDEMGMNIILNTLPNENRYGSIAVISLTDKVGAENIIMGDEKKTINKMSASISDGINAKGLICSFNLVKNNKINNVNIPEFPINGTKPSAEKTIMSSMICKYLLDTADSVDDAIDKFNNVNVICPQTTEFEYHWQLSDSTKSVAIEVINGNVEIISTENPNSSSLYGWGSMPIKSILSNFRLYPTHLVDGYMKRTNETNTASPSNIQMYGRGIERYNMALDIISSFSDTPTFDDIWHVTNDDIEYDSTDRLSIKCNRNYKTKETTDSLDTEYLPWCSDFAGFNDSLKVYTNIDEYQNNEAIHKEINNYIKHKQCINSEANKVWETFYTCIIDLNKTPMKDDSTKLCYKLYVLTEKAFKVDINEFFNLTKSKYEFELPVQ